MDVLRTQTPKTILNGIIGGLPSPPLGDQAPFSFLSFTRGPYLQDLHARGLKYTFKLERLKPKRAKAEPKDQRRLLWDLGTVPKVPATLDCA